VSTLAITAETDTQRPNQFALLAQRRFAPIFWTLFLGAANDNVFKFALMALVIYQLQAAWLPLAFAGMAIGALFILPFMLFSAISGQLADKLEKSALIRFVKTVEIAIMAVAAVGFAAQNTPLLLVCVLMMGLHAALMSPLKYAYLPQHLSERELTGGNAMVETGTFVALLLGYLAAGLLTTLPEGGVQYAGWACVGLALLGRATAQFVPASPAADPQLRINWNLPAETWRNLKLAQQDAPVFRSLLGISWMWFFGSVFLLQLPAFATSVLHGDERVTLLLLLILATGIGIGALLCEALSRRHVEIGLVPLGAIGMSLFAIDLYFASRGLPVVPAMGWHEFVVRAAHWRVLADLSLLSLFAGLYSVPMYAQIQIRSQRSHRARIVAANNVMNAVFIIGGSVIAGALLGAGFDVSQVFLFVGLANALVAFAIFMLVPEYLLRFTAFLVTHCVYRFRVHGDEHIPIKGAAILVCNHVSFADAVLLMAASPRPIRFIMDHRIFRLPVLGALFRLAKAIPVAPREQAPETYERAFEAARHVLDQGGLLCIFPEGRITRTGELNLFKGGIMKILQTHPVPVVPLALHNLWGSYFSRAKGRGLLRRGVWRHVRLVAASPMQPSAVTPERLRYTVQNLLSS